MLLKRGGAEDVYAAALQRLRDRVRAGLPQSCATSPIARSSSQRREVRKKDLRVTQLTGWRKPQGTTACWEHGRCPEDADGIAP
jgi:hypothetical protein